MRKHLWSKFLGLLLAVAVIGLSGAFLLREFMVRDFRAHLQSEMEDRILWLAASLESSYATHDKWEPQNIIDTIVWAAMMGLDIKIYNEDGILISDTEAAFNSLSPPVNERVETFYHQRVLDADTVYNPYPLMLGGRQLGRLDARILPPKKEAVFIARSNRILLSSTIFMGGIAVILSFVFARRLARPISDLTKAAAHIAEGDLDTSVITNNVDELGTLARTFNQMAANLQKQEELRKKLTSNIAHELRTPISAVRGEIEGMIDGFIPVEKEELQSLYTEVGRLKKILDAIEDLSQAEASSLNIVREEIDIKIFLSNIVERYSRTFEEKHVRLDLECPDGLIIPADPDKLSQIIINLLTNALKATSENDAVQIIVRKVEGWVDIICADTGAGIDRKDIPFIFERFYRGTKGGLGLGLTIVKELAEAHGGMVRVSSMPGEGAKFTVSLPA